MVTPDNKTSVRQTILDMAKEFGVDTKMSAIDVTANAISYLADNDVSGAEDEAFQALVNMRRAGLLSTPEGHRLLMDLMDEEKQIL